jgi:hypothetical protein
LDVEIGESGVDLLVDRQDGRLEPVVREGRNDGEAVGPAEDLVLGDVAEGDGVRVDVERAALLGVQRDRVAVAIPQGLAAWVPAISPMSPV